MGVGQTTTSPLQVILAIRLIEYARELEPLGPMSFEIRWEREKRMTRGKRGGWNLGSELELLELDSLRSAKVRA